MRRQFFYWTIGVLIFVAPQLTQATLVTQRMRGRKIEVRVFDKVPVKLKVTDDAIKAFENPDSPEWAKSFKVEITNLGKKPIYFISLKLITNVRQEEQLGFVTDFGPAKLKSRSARAAESDVAIKPEETKTLVLRSQEIEQWIDDVKRGAHADASTAWLVIQTINFGDGTGFVGNVPYPLRTPIQ